MVVTRNGSRTGRAEGKLVKRSYSKRKYHVKAQEQDQRLFSSGSLQVHHQNDHQSPSSAPQPQLVRSGAGNLNSSLLKRHNQSTVTHSHKGGITRMARRVTDVEAKSIQKTQHLQPKNISGSDVEARLHNSIIQGQEAVNMNMQSAFAAKWEGTLHLGATNTDKYTSQVEENAASYNANNHEEERGNYGFRSSSNRPTTCLNLTEIVEHMDIDDEVDSLLCNSSLICVRGYKIKPEYVELLGSILSKYGDIAANCDKPVPIRSLYLEHLCEALQKLKSTKFEAITRSELEDMMASLCHIEGEHVEVDWLKKRVSVICEAKQALSVLKATSDVRQRLVQQKSNSQSIKKQLEIYKKEYAIKKAEIPKLEEKIHVANNLLSEVTAEVIETETMLSNYKSSLREVFGLNSLAQNLI